MSGYPKMLYCDQDKKGSKLLVSLKHKAGYCVVSDESEEDAAIKDGYRVDLETSDKPVSVKKKTAKKAK